MCSGAAVMDEEERWEWEAITLGLSEEGLGWRTCLGILVAVGILWALVALAGAWVVSR